MIPVFNVYHITDAISKSIFFEYFDEYISLFLGRSGEASVNLLSQPCLIY